ncbi:hypothetical protein HMPREF3213_01331 [Heyndrickxia coagulans]|uniref:Uncharacterized protein n=1 Tax=Heyndrickxia coagulans TaxID=1398 RepID=A0A133KUI4_HEYCO|nr:hypothetical protein HMPREF3213_01331 [Heyndrickxia coagulans]
MSRFCSDTPVMFVPAKERFPLTAARLRCTIFDETSVAIHR